MKLECWDWEKSGKYKVSRILIGRGLYPNSFFFTCLREDPAYSSAATQDIIKKRLSESLATSTKTNKLIVHWRMYTDASRAGEWEKTIPNFEPKKREIVRNTEFGFPNGIQEAKLS